MSFQSKLTKRFSMPAEVVGRTETVENGCVASEISPNAFSSIIKIVVGNCQPAENAPSEEEAGIHHESEHDFSHTEKVTELDISELSITQNLAKEQAPPESPNPESISASSTTSPAIFWVHEEIISPRSAFFQQAILRTKNVNERTIHLPNQDPEIFKLYLTLLYTKQLPILPLTTPKQNPDHENKLLCTLYVLASYLQDTLTKNLLIDALIHRSRATNPNGSRYFPGASCIKIIYEGTPPDSPARRLLVDFYVDHLEMKVSRQRRDLIPRDFWVDVAVRALSRRPLPKGVTTADCDTRVYHCGSGGECGEERVRLSGVGSAEPISRTSRGNSVG